MSSPDSSIPETLTVTCPACHERLGVRLTAHPQKIACTFCDGEISVPSQAQVQRRIETRRVPPPPQVEGYALADSETESAAAEPDGGKPAGAPSAGSTDADDTIVVECATCHERVPATVGPQPGRVQCTFCQAVIPVPDRQTAAHWQAARAKPRVRADVGEYEVGAVVASPPLRSSTVFDRLAEVRQEPRPEPPRSTFFSRVLTQPWHADTILRWGYLSLGYTAILGIGEVFRYLVGANPGIATLALAFFILPCIWLVFFSLSYTAACGLHIFESTAAGVDRIEAWPEPNWRDWMAELFYLGWIGVIPLALGAGAAQLLLPWHVPPVLTAVVVWFVLYPIALLSAMDADSVWVPLTGQVLKSLARWWWCWLTFYAIAGVLAGTLVSVFALLVVKDWMGVLPLLGPVVPALALIYFRLLGRLAWRMTARIKKPKPAVPPKASPRATRS